MSEEVIQCVICKKDIEHRSHNGEVYWTHGNNAQPVADGRCCDACDCLIVIPFRLSSMFLPEAVMNAIHGNFGVGTIELENRLERYKEMNHGEE